MQFDDSGALASPCRPRCCVAPLLLLAAAPSQAQLRLDITQGVRDAVPIAVVPFGGQAEGAATDVAAVIANDLQHERPLRAARAARPGGAPDARRGDPLRGLAAAASPTSSSWAASSPTARPRRELRAAQRAHRRLAARPAAAARRERGLRATAHRIADLVFERLTGIPGAFSTPHRLRRGGRPAAGQRYRLIVADADGYNPRTMLESREPIMSPAWSPDGQDLAYVSFESKASAIYVQRLATGERRRVSARAGINGAPAWSPDGRQLALTLSRDGNLDIYTLELATQTLTRVTSDDAIDTEPEWSRDGQQPVLHVGPRRQRAGLPRGARRARARPSASPSPTATTRGRGCRRTARNSRGDARPRRLPHRASWTSRSRNLRVLTNGRQDESPSFAPNGALLIYATRETRPRLARDRLGRRPVPAAAELGPGRRARAGVAAVSGLADDRAARVVVQGAQFFARAPSRLESVRRSRCNDEVDARACRRSPRPGPRGLPEAKQVKPETTTAAAASTTGAATTSGVGDATAAAGARPRSSR